MKIQSQILHDALGGGKRCRVFVKNHSHVPSIALEHTCIDQNCLQHQENGTMLHKSLSKLWFYPVWT